MSQTESFEFWIYGNRTEVQIRQFFSEDYGGMVWPAAKTIGSLLSANPERVRGKTVLELGCGTGLSGIVAAKCGARVLFSDKRDPPEILDNCKENCVLNGLTDYEVVVGSASVERRFRFSGESRLRVSLPSTWLLAQTCSMTQGVPLSACSSLVLDDLLFTVSFVLYHNPQCQLLFAFPYREYVLSFISSQDRSSC